MGDMLADAYYQHSNYTFVGDNPIRYNDPDGKIITDGNGNVVVTTTGKQTTGAILIDKRTYKDGSASKSYIQNTYEIVSIFADNGTPIQALRLTSSIQINQTFDKDGNNTGSYNSTPDPNTFESQSDCHGYTFANGSLWINDDQVGTILDNDNYTRNTSESEASIVVFKKDGSVVHSGKRNADGTYNNDAGILTLQKGVTLGQASRNLTDINKKGNVEFDKKNSPNRIIDTNLGTVDDRGNRIISDQKEIAQFLQETKKKKEQ